METTNWEVLVDNRYKYTSADLHWNKVSIETATNFPLNLSQLKTSTCILATRYKAYLPYIFNYDVRSDDIWIITYPKSGNCHSKAASIFLVTCLKKNLYRNHLDTGNGLVD